MRLLRDAGFAKVESVPTDGHPGIFATLDAGARRTIGLYFMYDVKQADPKEWRSPPWDAAVVDVPKVGKVVMGRGAVNQALVLGHAVHGLACCRQFCAGRALARFAAGPDRG
jgi:acetylornithine deacetylase/succinyl-diaminopimelate desuccinylase-like protein